MRKYMKSHRTRFLRVLQILMLFASLAITSANGSQPVHAQEGGVKPLVVRASNFAESLPAGDLPRAPASTGEVSKDLPQGEVTQVDSENVIENPMLPLPRDSVASAAASASQTAEPALPALATGLNIPAPITSFEGVSNQDNFNAFGFRVSPPDTNGDVGPNHYVQMVNLLVRIFDKSGNPLTGPFKLSSLFAPLGGQCAAGDAGDPIVLYDPLADRWLLSQFAFVSLSTPPYHECIAISRTGDPTGSYFLYDFVTPGNEFPDYPKLGVWPDAYYMTVNQFTNGGPFNGTGAYAFERAKMLTGDPTASFIYFNLNLATHPEGIGGMLPSDFDGLISPPSGRPNTFAYFIADEFGDPQDALRLFDFHADFANPGSSTFTERPESPVAVAAFDPRSPSGRRDIVQPPPATTTNALDSISDRLMHRMQYVNNGMAEWLVTNHTVNVSGSTIVGTYRAGVRYYQLSSSGGAFTVAEQATFDPADGNSRWMGSAAVDNQGNLAVGYSVSSTSTFPSIRYAGRLATDPPGGLFQGENTLINGSGVQLSTTNRWGDYSALMVDPVDDCTFWYTTEYYTTASQATSTVGWLTRIGSFKFAECTAPAQGTLTGTVTNSANGSPVSGALVQVSNGFSRLTDATGNYSLNLTPGTYSVTVSAFGFNSATATVTINDGATTVQDFALTPLPAHTVSGHVFDGFNQPIAGATVTILSMPIPPATTDASGFYTIANVPEGTYDVRAQAGRCIIPQTQQLVVDGDETLDFTLPQKSDSFGYICQEIAANYVEASNVLPLTGDDVSQPLALPFPFKFYGISYNTAFVCTNGYLNFLAANCLTTNVAIPASAAPNGVIYPYWDDLFVDALASVRTELLGQAPNRQFVIEWRNVRYFSDTTRRVDFEVLLNEDGSILTQYRNIAADGREQGNSATVGIENHSGTVALRYSFNEPALFDGLAVLYSLPSLYQQRVNAGGSQYVDIAGNTWAADQQYTAGSFGYTNSSAHVAKTKKAIAGTDDDPLYQSQRVDPVEYRFDGLPNGSYLVELRFAEVKNTNPGTRLFDVILEGTLVLPAHDVAGEVGSFAADHHTFIVAVTDGQLNIRLVGPRGYAPPIINAISVTHQPGR